MFLISLLDMPQQAARSAHCDWLWTALTLHHGFPLFTCRASILPTLLAPLRFRSFTDIDVRSTAADPKWDTGTR
eukprot:3317799-Karenia_brevis.AAC.1